MPLIRFHSQNYKKTTLFIYAFIIFVLANSLISYLPLRFDFSYGRAYTLSNATRKIIKNLDDTVTIKIFASSDLPLALLPIKTDVIDLAKEYAKQGKRKVKVVILDPKKDQKAQVEAKTIGIPELQFSQIEKDKYAVSASFFGIAILYADKKEIIPQATNVEGLEYDITSSIYKMLQKKPIKIALTGFETKGTSQNDDFYTIKTILSRSYEFDYLDSQAKTPQKIDKDTKTIIVLAPNDTPVSDGVINLIKDYISHDGHVIFMIDGLSVSDSLTVGAAQHNLFNFLKSYGIILNKDLVLSKTAEIANFTRGTIGFFTPYPYWIKTANIVDKGAAFSAISTLTFPWASSVKTTKIKGVETKVLVKSEKNSWTATAPLSLLPDSISAPDPKKFKEQLLVVESGKEKQGRLMVISSSRFVKEPYLAQGRGNVAFFTNIVNDYASEGALSGIRSRTLTVYPLKDVSDTTKDVVKYTTIFLLPALMALYGANRFLKRR